MDQMSDFARTIMQQKYLWVEKGEKDWSDIANRVTKNVMRAAGVKMNEPLAKDVYEMILNKEFIPGGRYLYACGRQYHQVQNCLLLKAEDSREGWSDLMQKACMALMTGAGIGVDYTDIRCRGSKIRKTGGSATGPLALMQMLNEAGRGIMQGGSRRSAIWAGLRWDHKDCLELIRLKDWPLEVRKLKEKDFNFPATLDGTNVSIQLDDEFFQAFHNEKNPLHGQACTVYWETVRQMLSTAEPGFSVDTGANAGESLRNACTEVTSRDDSDICNIGSINMSKIKDLEHMTKVVGLATAFLMAGTLYSDVPYSKVDIIRSKNRRLGLGLMGIHEWLLTRGKPYGADTELLEYLKIYQTSTAVAKKLADEWEVSRPVKTRAIAPTGTIGILAETTTGVEPILCAAYKRRYLKHTTWNHQYVVDPTAKRLIEKYGCDPDSIEDAYSISPKRRVEFQAWLQQFVDHGISSTINLPAWGSEENNEGKVREFGDMLIQHLPSLRGITCYPDGARGGQPITPVKYKTAAGRLGEVFTEALDVCELSKGGSCGS